MPRPNSAVTIGRPAATSVPKVRTQHERGDHQADRLGGQLALLRGGDDLAAHLDAQPVPARGLAQRDQALARGDRHAVGPRRERQPRDGDRPVARDLGGRGVADALEARGGGQQRVGALAAPRRSSRRPSPARRRRRCRTSGRGSAGRAGRRRAGTRSPASRSRRRTRPRARPRRRRRPPARRSSPAARARRRRKARSARRASRPGRCGVCCVVTHVYLANVASETLDAARVAGKG